jgi:hypothetical protein
MSEPVQALERQLRSLAPLLAYPSAPRLAEAVAPRLASSRRPPRLGWLRPAVTVLAVAVLVLIVSPGARRAVASWLGLGGIRIVLVETPVVGGTAPLSAALGTPVSLEEAEAAVPFQVSVPSIARLGTPQVFLSEAVPGGMISLLYPAEEGTGPGLLITEFAGVTDSQLVTKELGPGTTIVPVAIAEGGFWIEGDPHTVLFEDRSGDIQADEPRLAGNTLIWSADGVTTRLESAIELEQAMAIARSMR